MRCIYSPDFLPAAGELNRSGRWRWGRGWRCSRYWCRRWCWSWCGCGRRRWYNTGIVQFRGRENVVVGFSTCGEHPAIGEQCLSAEAPSIIEAACDRPISRGRVVNFRARERAVAAANATCDQHLTIGQQCFVVAPAANVETAGRCPISGRRVVNFCACHYSTVISPSTY